MQWCRDAACKDCDCGIVLSLRDAAMKLGWKYWYVYEQWFSESKVALSEQKQA